MVTLFIVSLLCEKEINKSLTSDFEILIQTTKAEYYKSLISGYCSLAVISTIYKGNGGKEK